ncbi:MAG: ABC transporter substrate-binding protein [Rhodospirillales bacterium]|nr:ABC transporter substrate-binding protein [Rhodospirillales bacterium]
MFRNKFLALAAIVAVFAVIGAASAQTKIKVGRTLSGSGFHVPVYIAFAKGFFKKEGLDAEAISMTGKALVTAGISGNIDFLPVPGGGSQASLMGADLKYVVGESLISQWAIVADSKIKSVKDLKGKTLGYGRAGAADYDEGEIVLSRFFNMNVGRDYKVISFQSESDRVAGLINGDVAAALMSFPTAARAQAAGFNMLLKTGQYLPRVGGSIWTRASFVKEHPETVKKFIRAIAGSIEYLRTNKEGSVEVIMEEFGIKDKNQAGIVWQEIHDQYTPDLPADLFKKLFVGRQKRMVKRGLWPKGKPMPDVNKFIARELLDETLREMGYFLQPRPKPKAS